MVLATPRLAPATLKHLAVLICCVPAILMAIPIATDDLGANPIEAIERLSGLWTLRLLVVALAVTPLRRLTGWGTLIAVRRTFGLATFWYALVHMAVYAAVDQAFDLHDIGADILKRPYITVGVATLIILLALAATSPRSMVKRLGAMRWRRLHRLVYPAALLGCFHYEMVVKGFQVPPFIYGGILLVLFGIRFVPTNSPRPRRTAVQA